MKVIRLVGFSSWGVSNDANGERVSELVGTGANGGRYRILIPATRENVKELAYATGQALALERDEHEAMEEYAAECVRKPVNE